MESDISEYQVSSYLPYYDLFKTRNVNSDRRRAFERISDRYIGSNEITDNILAYDDVELLRYVMYKRGVTDPSTIIPTWRFVDTHADKVLHYIAPYMNIDISSLEYIDIGLLYPWFYDQYIYPVISRLDVYDLIDLWIELYTNGGYTDLLLEKIVQILSNMDRRIFLKEIEDFLIRERSDIENEIQPPGYMQGASEEDIERITREWEITMNQIDNNLIWIERMINHINTLI